MLYRKPLFIISLLEMMIIGGGLTLFATRLAFLINHNPSFLQGPTNGNITGAGVDGFYEKSKFYEYPEVRNEISFLVSYFWDCVILFCTNVCLIYATKDTEETSKLKKFLLLEMWVLCMLLYICKGILTLIVTNPPPKPLEKEPQEINISWSFWVQLMWKLCIYLMIQKSNSKLKQELNAKKESEEVV